MKACFIVGEFPPMAGGVGDYTYHLAQALKALGTETATVTSIKASSSQQPTVYPIVADWGIGSWRPIRATLAQTEPQILHIQYQAACYGLNPMVSLLPLIARRARPGLKVVTTFHDLLPVYLFPKAGPLRHLPATLLIFLSDAIIIVDETDLAVPPLAGLLRLYPRIRRKISVIPIGSNIPFHPISPEERRRQRWELRVQDDEVLLGHFGFLHPTKGVDTIIEAVASLVRRGKKVKLLMIGGEVGASDPSSRGYSRIIKARIRELSLQERGLWTGYVGTQEISAFLQCCDICVLPFTEGASLRHGTLVAALAHGLPIVTTTPSRPGTFLRHLENTVWVQPQDAIALEAVIAEVMNSSDLRHRLSQGALQIARSLSWESIAEKTLGLYVQLVGSSIPGPVASID